MSPPPQNVNFLSRGIKISGHLYTPASSAPSRSRAAIIVGHPVFGVKEQAAGLYARELAAAGFITLAFDAAHQGESEGLPRLLEDPYQRVEDFKSAVSYLSTLDSVDETRIGVLGICGSGGYVPFAAQTDVRMRAVATISAACFGDLTRHGVKDAPPAGQITPEQLAQQLQAAGLARIAEAKGAEPELQIGMPDDKNLLPAELPENGMVKEAFVYYKTPQGGHPRSVMKEVMRGVELRANYDSYAFVDMIAPRPLLMIVGGEADTAYQSERAIAKAKEPKELFVVEGKTHVALYLDTTETVPKLVDFMATALCE